MRLCRLVYKSLATAEVVSNPMLRELEQQAVAANTQRDITGLLVLTGNVFVQVLEGDALELTSLFSKIACDGRHRAVELLSVRAVDRRLFEGWSMRAVDLYDLPGEKRALMAAKYEGKDGMILVPDDEPLVSAFLLDAKFVCSSSPWQTGGDSENAIPGVENS